MKLSVVIASMSRRDILHETVLSVLRQSWPPDEILLSVTSADDCSPQTCAHPAVRVVTGPKGLTKQRNTALDQLSPDTDIIVFFDDDIELHGDYLKNCCAAMNREPSIVAMTGKVLVDGSVGDIIGRADARKMLAEHRLVETIRDRTELYGCNMVVRANIAREVRFDERLSLYALFEDIDFAARCANRGRIVYALNCVLVHLATPAGRLSARRLGFAQVMNVYYLWRKGSLKKRHSLMFLTNMLLANVGGLVLIYKNRSRADRVNQIFGNILACLAIMRFGACPERIVLLEGDSLGANILRIIPR